MTPPIRPEQRPDVYLQYLWVSDPEKAGVFMDWLRETGQEHVIKTAMRQRDLFSGALENKHRAQAETDPQTALTLGEDLSRSFASGADAFTFGLAGIAQDAAGALGDGTFRANRDARQQVYGDMPMKDRILSSVAGGIVNPVGAMLRPAAAGVSTIGRVGRAITQGAKEGALQGGLSGFGENIGATDGVLAGTVAGTVGGAVGGAVLSPLALALSRAGKGPFVGQGQLDHLANIPEPQPNALRDVFMANTADIADGRGVVPTPPPEARSFRMTGAAPRTPSPTPQPNAPTPMGVDVAGPNLRATMRGATNTVPGQEAVRPAFAARAEEAPRAMERVFDETTGTTAKDADALALELATAQRALAIANASQKAAWQQQVDNLTQQYQQAVAARQAYVPPAKPQPRTVSDVLDVLDNEAVPQDAFQELERLRTARGATSGPLYASAEQATRGVPVDDPVVDEFLQTELGKKAFRQAMTEREGARFATGDPSRVLPTVEKWDGADLVDAPVPDAEAVHYFKRWLADMGRLSPEAMQAEGLSASGVANAKQGFTRMRGGLAPEYQSADAAHAEASAPIRALQQGLASTSSNPAGRGAERRALSTVEQQVAEMSPEVASAYRIGARQKIRARVQGMSPSMMATQLADPRTDLAREVALAYGPDAPARFAQAFATPDPTPANRPLAVRQPNPPRPVERELAAPLQAGLRGLDVTRTRSIPSGANPERSLPTLEADRFNMGADEQEYLRRGASAAFRREMSSGPGLKLDVPERARQFGFAAKSPALANALRGQDEAWGKALGLQSDILPAGQLGVSPEAESGIHRAFEALGNSPQYTLIRSGREFTDRAMGTTSALRKARDASLGRDFTTASPEALADALARQIADDLQESTGRSAGSGAGSALGKVYQPSPRKGSVRRPTP